MTKVAAEVVTSRQPDVLRREIVGAVAPALCSSDGNRDTQARASENALHELESLHHMSDVCHYQCAECSEWSLLLRQEVELFWCMPNVQRHSQTSNDAQYTTGKISHASLRVGKGDGAALVGS